MFFMTVTPRFYETDALGHINNTVLSNWFEASREPVFRLFNPALALNGWNLILARVEIDYVAQTHYGKPVEVRSWIGRIGIRPSWSSRMPGRKGCASRAARRCRCSSITRRRKARRFRRLTAPCWSLMRRRLRPEGEG